MFQAQITKMMAITATVLLINDSPGGAKGAPPQMPRNTRLAKSTLLNWQSMRAYLEINDGPELAIGRGYS